VLKYVRQKPHQITLFFSEKYSERCTGKIEMLSHPVFKKSFIRLFDILRQITKESKGWYL
jgi:hypothetical protein